MRHKNAAPTGVYQQNKADFASSNKEEGAAPVEEAAPKPARQKKIITLSPKAENKETVEEPKQAEEPAKEEVSEDASPKEDADSTEQAE